MSDIRIYLIVITVIFLCYAFGYIMGFAKGNKKKKKKKKGNLSSERLHCFQCEIEMPVKEKNGIKYCSNCGLRH